MAKKRTSAKRRRRGFPIWATILISMLSCLLIFSIIAVFAINSILNKISRPDLTQDYITEEELMEIDLQEAVLENAVIGEGEEGVVYPELDPSEIQWTTATNTIGDEENLINILLIGQDAREGETRARSDTMILMTFDKNNGTITMTSFLRDLYVQIPGYQDNRINAAFAFGGMRLLDETLMQNFGVSVDANVSVNFEGFSQIIDILGGVDIELTQQEAAALGLPSGMNHLNGSTALDYARIRKIDNDFGRTARQRKVISALLTAFKDASMSQINDLLNEILPLITTDMTNMQIVSYMTELFPMLSGATISSCTIPADGTYSFNTVREMEVIVADFEANRQILQETLEPSE